MRQAWLSAILLLAACSRAPETREISHSLTAFDSEPAAQAPASKPSGPQIAYSYRLSYLLDGDAVAPVQAQAQAACRTLGPRRCVVVRADLSNSDDGDGSASLSLLIDARLAGRFEERLGAIARDAGGTSSGRSVTAEDVTKQIVDTGARVRARQALADRLLGIIRSANGKVGELVEAEKAYAQVQEELDAARSLDAELRRRVAMSAVDISYNARSATGTWAPVTQATRGLAGSIAASLAALVTFVAVAAPWMLLLALLVWLVRRAGWRLRLPWRRKLPPA